MKSRIQSISMMALALTFGFITNAEAGPAVKSDIREARLAKRDANQDLRIANGIQSGELSGAEIRTLNAQQERLDKYQDKILADGKVTKAEAKTLHKRLNNSSQDIFKQKHDDQTKASNPEKRSRNRVERQQGRIDKGIAKGMLTDKEAASLQARQDRIEKFRAKAMEDGKLSKKEAAQIEKRQDKASKKIAKKKHNDKLKADAPVETVALVDDDITAEDVNLSTNTAVAVEAPVAPVAKADAIRAPASTSPGVN